jgi:hypothetical protein
MMNTFIVVYSMFLMHMYLPVSTMHSTVKQLYTDHDLVRVVYASEDERTARRHLVRVKHRFAPRSHSSRPTPNDLFVLHFRQTSDTTASARSKRNYCRRPNGDRCAPFVYRKNCLALTTWWRTNDGSWPIAECPSRSRCIGRRNDLFSCS